MISSVWSSFGHRFSSTGNYDGFDHSYETCMTCGAEYILEPDYEMDPDGSYGKYVAANGDDPFACTGRTDLVHGYERVCQNDNGRPCKENRETGNCKHIDFICNCIQCD